MTKDKKNYPCFWTNEETGKEKVYFKHMIKCPRCEFTAKPVVSAGKGPHSGKLSCSHCGGFLKWLPKETAAEYGIQPSEAEEERQMSLF